MKRIIMIAALTAIVFAACNNSIDETTMRQDVHRIVAKTEQCYANVHNDLIDSLDEEYFASCNDELNEMMADNYKKYRKEEDRRKFDSIFFEEIQNSNIENDYISLMLEIYGMNEDN
ncbi:MAG: hypothetical protein IJP80_01410 [Bacteroidales bacterium]|nr:hypothetical protein [Bacteroidales bacterium]